MEVQLGGFRWDRAWAAAAEAEGCMIEPGVPPSPPSVVPVLLLSLQKLWPGGAYLIGSSAFTSASTPTPTSGLNGGPVPGGATTPPPLGGVNPEMGTAT